MESIKTLVTASPHVHSQASTRLIMRDVLIAMTPAFLGAVYVFGIGSLIITAVAIASCVLFEYLIQKYLMKQPSTISDLSAVVTGMILAFNLPTNIPIWMIVVGSLIAIGVAKMSFGGLGFNIFNPALVGRVFLLISFPVQMTSWPLPFVNRTKYLDSETGATVLSLAKEANLMGESVSTISAKISTTTDMFLGLTGGSLGEMSTLALVLGGLYLIYRKVITWHIPVSILVTMFVVASIFWFTNADYYLDPFTHIIVGGAVSGAIYMATDMATSPMTKKGMLVFGVGVGLITIFIRLFGAYPEGVSFAILIMNAFVPLINMYMKPKRFGDKVKVKLIK